MSFQQPDHETTFSEFGELLGGINLGAAVIGIASLIISEICGIRSSTFKLKNPIAAGRSCRVRSILAAQLFRWIGGALQRISDSHLVQVPIAPSLSGFFQSSCRTPDFSQWTNPAQGLPGGVWTDRTRRVAGNTAEH